jgi:thiol:disulfide interchange protein
LLVLADFWDVIWWLLWAFLLAAYFYILIVVFADLWTNEWNGWITAIWTVFIFFLPLIGILAYMIFRPEPTPEQKAALFRQQHGISTAEELSMLSDLHDKGALSDEEFAKQKAKLLG